MDKHKVWWVLEFILRQLIPDWLANKVLRELPLPPDPQPQLQKTILLRRLRSDLANRRLSEEVLRSLELIEDIDRSLGEEPSEAMRTVYCAVAVECTVRHLRESGGGGGGGGDSEEPGSFFEAVNGIWNRRVADLEWSAARGLLSRQMREWRRVMEEAVVDPAVRACLLLHNTRSEALDSLEEYLRRATKEMGPPLLQLAA